MSRKYKDAAQVLASLSRGQGRGKSKKPGKFHAGGLKTLTYSNRVQNKPATYALVCETLKYRSVLESILAECKLAISSFGREEALVLVMMYDFLFGHGIEGGGAIKRALNTHEDILKKSMTLLMEKAGATSHAELLPDHIRDRKEFERFARVNIMKVEVKDVLEQLGKEFENVKQDDIVPYVIALPPKTDLHNHPLVTEGKIVLQDKASTLPVHALAQAIAQFDEPWASIDTDPNRYYGLARKLPTYDVIDACAAPGNKTSQMGALLNSTNATSGGGKVFAFDKSERRLGILESRMKEVGATNVVPMLQNFLEVNVTDKVYSNVKAIVLDPSCSGSGMVGTRVDHLVDTNNKRKEDTGGRLERLADFQLKCLRKAMSFPQVEYISYSTCSIHAIENEMVVQQALETQNAFQLIPALPQWHRRGHKDSSITLSTEQVENLVRVDPTIDDTNGFFVALFRRKSSSIPKTLKRAREELAGNDNETQSKSAKKNTRMKERRKRRRNAKRTKVE